MRNLLKKLFFILFISLFFISSPQAFDTEHFFVPKIKVMDQNMYFGADVSPLFGGDLTQIPLVIGEIIASNYPARAAAFAEIIKKSDSDVVCLQEAWIFQLAPRGDLGLPDGINWDFKELLLDALGGDYKEVVTNEGLMDVNLLTLLGVRIKDQDVIIAKENVKIGKTETLIFDHQLTLPIPDPIGPQTFFREDGILSQILI
jgi:hypothetical protein